MRYTLYTLSCLTLIAATLFGAGVVHADFPAPQRERIEWCDIWFTDAEKAELPRVLMIGDSITRGYFSPVEERLGGKAYCGRYTSSRSVCDPIYFQELQLVLGQYEYAVIHVNNGLHGWGYTEEQYRDGLVRLLDMLAEKAPKSAIIWATTTPVRSDSGMSDQQSRVDARNTIARELVEARDIAIDDLHALAAAHMDYLGGDGVHFSDAGRRAQAEQVAQHIAAALPPAP